MRKNLFFFFLTISEVPTFALRRLDTLNSRQQLLGDFVKKIPKIEDD
jgi:hypothetical protein